MYLNENDGHIHMSVKEFVTLARRGISEHIPTDGSEPHAVPTLQDARTRYLGGGRGA